MYNVMVVDDEVNILKLMDIWLTRAGFGVITATNGEEALAKLKKEEVDLIVADVMMPKMIHSRGNSARRRKFHSRNFGDGKREH